MSVGPNYVLDKGFRASGVAAYEAGTFVSLTSNDQEVAVTAAAAKAIGVCQESVDADKVATGKVTLDVRLLGIARVRAGAAITIGNTVEADASGFATPFSAGEVAGIALSAASAGDVTAGGHVDVLLTP